MSKFDLWDGFPEEMIKETWTGKIIFGAAFLGLIGIIFSEGVQQANILAGTIGIITVTGIIAMLKS